MKGSSKLAVFFLLLNFTSWLFFMSVSAQSSPSVFQVGAGISDITGPAAEIGMMGYAKAGQNTAGIHIRLRARSYIFIDFEGKRSVIVNCDLGMAFDAVKLSVIEKLEAIYGANIYTADNVLITGTHTHAGPAGFSTYLLYLITCLGFDKQNFNGIVDGIVDSIAQAHDSIRPAHVYVNQGKLYHANINRSPTGYLGNPEAERALYPDGDTDKTITVLKLQGLDGTEIGALTFFSVHGTSMFNTNRLISGDNKGIASLLFEKNKNGPESRPGRGPFIAAFVQSNAGDVSPNIAGTFCPDGSPCENEHSTCGGKNEGCQGRGPGKTDMESAIIIGQRQMDAAIALYENATTLVQGTVDFRHQFTDMSAQVVDPIFIRSPFNRDVNPNQQARTCRAALGNAFAAGTTDGPGAFNFIQGSNATNPFWDELAKFIIRPTEDQIACQEPKPILLDVGQAKPTPWSPNILPVQLIKIGQVVIAGMPGEPTTMGGRRMRSTVFAALSGGDPSQVVYFDPLTDDARHNAQLLRSTGRHSNMDVRLQRSSASGAASADDWVVLTTGLTNSYSHYIATYEEYIVQRYEAASTLYGPHTLAAYQQLLYGLAKALVLNTPVPMPQPSPPDLRNTTWTLQPEPILDEHPIGGSFGQIKVDASAQYVASEDTASVTFYGGNLRNNLTLQSSFMYVEYLDASSQVWIEVADDGALETRLHWKREFPAFNIITCEWVIPATAQPGQYRIRHVGYAKIWFGAEADKPASGTPVAPEFGRLEYYEGVSRTFTVLAPSAAGTSSNIVSMSIA